MYADATIDAPRRAFKPKGSPAITGMVFALAFLAREPFMICLRRLLCRRKNSMAGLSLQAIRMSVLGRHQDHILNLLGRPLSHMPGKCPIWYYAIDARQQVAMAVTFHEGRAVMVEFLQPPL